jgi:predicted O-methyltransferase YrrM
MKATEAIQLLSNPEGYKSITTGEIHKIFPISIDAKEGEILANVVKVEDPKSILEIGTAYGYATLHILKALEDKEFSLTTIDPFQKGFFNIGRELIEKTEHKNKVIFIEELSEICLPRLLSEKCRYDFAMIDGSHKFDNFFIDLFYMTSLLNQRGQFLLMITTCLP